jgi:acid stress chaperone HdeB
LALFVVRRHCQTFHQLACAPARNAIPRLRRIIASTRINEGVMKIRTAALCSVAMLGSILGASLPAAAQDIDMSTITCKDFVSADKASIGNILIWLEGYYTKENDPPILHTEKMGTDGKNLGTYCGAHPDASIIQAAEKVMPVK